MYFYILVLVSQFPRCLTLIRQKKIEAYAYEKLILKQLVDVNIQSRRKEKKFLVTPSTYLYNHKITNYKYFLINLSRQF